MCSLTKMFTLLLLLLLLHYKMVTLPPLPLHR
jgi:hypothetical protein